VKQMDKKPLIGVSICAVILILISSMDGSVSAVQIRNHSVTIEITGQNIQKQNTINVSDMDLQKIKQVFTNVSMNLESASSPEEKLQVYWDAICRLYDLGVLGSLSCEEAYRLATVWYRPSTSLLKHHLMIDTNNTNTFCLVSGRVNYSLPTNKISNYVNTFCWVFFPFPPPHDTLLSFILYWTIFISTGALGSILQFIVERNPIAVGNLIGIGAYGYKAKAGWIKTDGLYGTKNWNGNLNGALPGYIWDGWIYFYQAISGFCGIKILIDNSWVGYDASYMGSALVVRINETG
jgi:hypothetical protein